MGEGYLTFRDWLSNHKCRKGFANSYQFAHLSMNIDKGLFKIPLAEEFLAEALANEERVKTKSVAVRDVIVHLLKSFYNDQTGHTSYDDVLLELLSKNQFLPPGINNPLTGDNTFHSLSIEVKIWIIIQIIQNRKVLDAPVSIGSDMDGNEYFRVGARLYVEYGKAMKGDDQSTYDNNNGSDGKSLDVHLRKIEWKLMADTDKMWQIVILYLEHFNDDELARKMVIAREAALGNMLTDVEKSNARDEFNTYLISLQPVPLPRRVPQQSPDTYDQRPPADPPQTFAPKPPRRTLCVYFDKCDRGSQCNFHHPEIACANFGILGSRCPGVTCQFKHPICEKDGECFGLDCTYRHQKSPSTLLRRQHQRPQQRRYQPQHPQQHQDHHGHQEPVQQEQQLFPQQNPMQQHQFSNQQQPPYPHQRQHQQQDQNPQQQHAHSQQQYRPQQQPPMQQPHYPPQFPQQQYPQQPVTQQQQQQPPMQQHPQQQQPWRSQEQQRMKQQQQQQQYQTHQEGERESRWDYLAPDERARAKSTTGRGKSVPRRSQSRVRFDERRDDDW